MGIHKPQSLTIGPHAYKILWSKKSWNKYAPDEEDKVGLCLSDKGVLLVNGWDLTESQQRDTLLHELLHACFALTGFQHQAGTLPKSRHDLEEVVVLVLTPTILQTIQDNKEVWEWLAQSS